ncbi:MAG: M20/M25/M40 family metallo-hydrolase [Bacillota bacterium]|nr:M20/M25/M40 family metallo-hydrolase [Bacillota bacterium]
MKDKIKEYASELYPEMLEFCKKIVKTPSEPGHEGEVAKLFEEELNKLGYDEVFTDAWGNVVGLVKGNKPGPVIMYNGHMDAVAAGNLETWEGYDPYGAEIDEAPMINILTGEEEMTEVIHGRGTGDLKCNLASQVYAGAILSRMKKDGLDVAGTFMLAAVVLEENGEMMGTIKLCEETLPAKGLEVDAMVCCEPSSMRVMLGHRGRMEIKVVVKGRSCHGSSPWLGVNAVEKSTKLIQKVHDMIWSKTIEDEYLGRPGIALTMYHCEPNELCIVPDRCVIVYDRRLIPGETTEGAIKEIQDIIDELAAEDPDFVAEVSVNENLRKSYTGKEEVIESAKEVWIIDREHPFVKACTEGLDELNEPIIYDYWPFSTDIPMLAVRMNKPVIGYGPGQEYLIHTPHEKVRLDYLERSLPANVMMYLKASLLPKECYSSSM